MWLEYSSFFKKRLWQLCKLHGKVFFQIVGPFLSEFILNKKEKKWNLDLIYQVT